jgi:hypothetical protein
MLFRQNNVDFYANIVYYTFMITVTSEQNKTLGMISYKNGIINCYTPDFILFTQVTADCDQAVEIMNKLMDHPEIFCDFIMDSHLNFEV